MHGADRLAVRADHDDGLAAVRSPSAFSLIRCVPSVRFCRSRVTPHDSVRAVRPTTRAPCSTRPAPPPDVTVRYGEHPDHVADVRLPAGRPGPLVIFLHGGFWRHEYDRSHTGPLATALAAAGFIVDHAGVPADRGAGRRLAGHASTTSRPPYAPCRTHRQPAVAAAGRCSPATRPAATWPCGRRPGWPGRAGRRRRRGAGTSGRPARAYELDPRRRGGAGAAGLGGPADRAGRSTSAMPSARLGCRRHPRSMATADEHVPLEFSLDLRRRARRSQRSDVALQTARHRPFRAD